MRKRRRQKPKAKSVKIWTVYHLRARDLTVSAPEPVLGFRHLELGVYQELLVEEELRQVLSLTVQSVEVGKLLVDLLLVSFWIVEKVRSNMIQQEVLSSSSPVSTGTPPEDVARRKR